MAEVWEFIGDQSGEVRTADRTVDAIIERLVMLAHNPRAGRLRDEIGPGVRSFPAGAYIVYYRLGRGDRVTIARVLHGSRDQWAAFDDAG